MLVNSFIFCLIPLLHYQYGQLASCVLCICHECAAVEQWSLMKCQGQSHYTGGPLIWVPTVAMASVTHGLPVSFSTFLVNPSSVSSWMWFQPVSTLHSPHHRRWWTFLPDVPPMSQVHAFNRAPYLPPTLCANYISCYTPHLNSITYIHSLQAHLFSHARGPSSSSLGLIPSSCHCPTLNLSTTFYLSSQIPANLFTILGACVILIKSVKLWTWVSSSIKWC